MKPQRLQLRRQAGFDLQAVSMALNGLPAVNCARPSRWGNWHKVGQCPVCHTVHTQAEAVAAFRKDITADTINSWFVVASAQRALRGRNLACWCKPGTPCHCDVWLEIANG